MDKLVVNKWIWPKNITNADSIHSLANKTIVKTPSLPYIVPHIRQRKKTPILQSNVQAPPGDNHKFKAPLPFSPKMKVIKTYTNKNPESTHQGSTALGPVKKNSKCQPKVPQQVADSRDSTKIHRIPTIETSSLAYRKPPQQNLYPPSKMTVCKQVSSFQLSKNPQVFIPLPSKFKIVNGTSTVQMSNSVEGNSSQRDSNFGEFDYSQHQHDKTSYNEFASQPPEGVIKFKSIETTPTQKKTISILSSTIISTGAGQNDINKENSPAGSGKADEQSNHPKLPFKLNPVKGMPWSLYTENASNSITEPNSTPQVSANRIVNKRSFIQLPSNWNLKNITALEASKIIESMKVSSSPHSFDGDLYTNENRSQPSVMTSDYVGTVDPTLAHNKYMLQSSTHSAPMRSLLDNAACGLQEVSSLADKQVQTPFGINFRHETTNLTLHEEPKTKKKKDDDKENDRLDIILEEIQHIRKQEVKNSANIKLLIKKIVEEDVEARSFSFPIKDEIILVKFEDCLLKPRFTKKLVASLENKIFNCTDKVSELVGTIFHPKLLIKYNVTGVKRGQQSKKSFQKLKINQLFLDLSGLSSKEYYSDLTRVINKMHMRYIRHPELCE